MSFEVFLEQRRRLGELSGWGKIVSTDASRIMTVEIGYLTSHTKIPVSHEIRQLGRLNAVLGDVMDRFRTKLAECAAGWNALVCKYHDERELKRLVRGREAARNVIWRGIRMIRCLAKASMPRTFRVLIGAMIQFQAIAQELDLGRELFCNIIGQLPGEAILVPFIVFNGTVAREERFMNDAENLAWVTLESCILTMLKENPVLLKQVVTLDDEIWVQHRRKCGKSFHGFV
jgi:hypothetical protein